jgi:hypothetical protein
METKFQTSFIPKKPMASPIGAVPSPTRAKVGSSLFMIIAVVLFIGSLLGAGGVYAYKQYLLKSLQSYKDELSTREKQFNTSLISELKGEEVKITTARNLLNSHLALSQVFDFISKFTIENVRFMSLDVSMPADQSSDIKISLQGYGTTLPAVAYQSKVFSQLADYGLAQIIKNPILSNPTIAQNGTVSFGFTASVDPKALSYEKLVSPAPASTTAPVAPAPAASDTGSQSPFMSQ